jgi:Holliday junction resolvase-like predicted endonuclease
MVNVEQKVILSVLKLTVDGSVLDESINKDANLPISSTRKLLRKLQSEGLVYLDRSNVEVSSVQRLKLALSTMRLGADPELVSSLLKWQEFEAVGSIALEHNGYSVTRNLHFKNAEKRWEIDVVGSRKPLIVCIDCKHWQRGLRPSALLKIVEDQVERTCALAQALPSLSTKMKCASWRQTRLIPVVLSLTTGETKFLNDVPVVSILQFRDFLNQLPAYADSLFSVKT